MVAGKCLIKPSNNISLPVFFAVRIAGEITMEFSPKIMANRRRMDEILLSAR